jgi:hypothetical protein
MSINQSKRSTGHVTGELTLTQYHVTPEPRKGWSHTTHAPAWSAPRWVLLGPHVALYIADNGIGERDVVGRWGVRSICLARMGEAWSILAVSILML